jgi:Flp pilus assembly protein CpaB
LIAAILVGNYVKSEVNMATERARRDSEMAAQQMAQQYNEQVQGLKEQLRQVDQRAQKAAEEAVRLLAEKGAASKASNAVIKKPKPSLALRTPPGKRALTVQIDSLGAVGGLINPGDSVDVIAHLSIPAKNQKGEDKKETVTAMIFQNLKVLAINTNIEDMGEYDDQQKEPKLKITVAVSPEEASLLSFADKNGKLELSLRGQNETRQQMISAATWATLAEYVLQTQGADIKVPEEEPESKVQAPAAPDEKEKPGAIQIYRGGKGL